MTERLTYCSANMVHIRGLRQSMDPGLDEYFKRWQEAKEIPVQVEKRQYKKKKSQPLCSAVNPDRWQQDKPVPRGWSENITAFGDEADELL